MPNGQVATRPRRSEIIALSAGLGAGGLLLIVLGLRGGRAPISGVRGPRPGESWGEPFSRAFEQEIGRIQIPAAMAQPNTFPISMVRPQWLYQGPGRNAYSHFRLLQVQRGQLVTVYGSGVAGVHVGPAARPTVFDLVSPTQPQPPGCQPQSLCAFPWPGVPPTPIAGAPPQPGYADAYLEIYEDAALSGDPRDADGFSSPTFNNRVPAVRRIYKNAVRFT